MARASIRDADRGERFYVMSTGEERFEERDVEKLEDDLEEQLLNKGHFVSDRGVDLIGDVDTLRAGDTIECKKYGNCVWVCVRY